MSELKPPIRFADMARAAGLVMCCLCFDAKSPEQMWTDRNGDTWDVCQECQAIEEQAIARMAE
jgi:hypothetical protein